MGKVAGAAVTVVAPEAKAARAATRAATGKSAAGSTAKGAGRRITPDMSSREVNDELQRRRSAAAKSSADKRSAGDTATATPATAPASPPPAPAGGGWSAPSVPAPVGAAASTGSGFLLGVFAWAVGLAYLRGGSPEVKRFFNAKFFNKTTKGTA
jgi:hypothetical protein